MKRSIGWGIFVLSLAGAVRSQQPTPKPSPTEGEVVKIATSVIQIDVTVTDRRGRIVPDLRPDEVEIYENGEKQTVTGFSFVSNVKTAPKEKKKEPEKAGVPEPPLVLRPEQVRRTIALVVDDLTLSFESAAHVRQALKKFLDEQMQDGDLVGIIRTGAGIGALQQFTSNKAQLYAAVERVRWNSSGRGRFGSFSPTEPTMNERGRALGDTEVKDADIKSEKDFLSGFNDFQEGVFTTGTLGALKYIVGGMGELPGRKSVILFSDGFQIFKQNAGGRAVSRNNLGDPAQIGTGSDGSTASRTLEFLQNLVDIANRKSVVFYTIDARGLEDAGITAADQFADPTLLDQNALQNIQQTASDRSNELFNTQQGLVYLAKQTGGFPYINQNDIGNGIREALDDQSYYLVAYEPPGDTFDPKTHRFNKIEVKVKRDDVRVRHRSGFFAQSEEDKPIRVDVNVPTKIMKALTSPFAVNDIDLRLNALFGHSEKRGYYIHSFLHIEAKDLNFIKLANGQYQAVFDVLAISYGDNGVPVDKNNVTGTMNFKPEDYERIRREGFSYSFIFPVKKPGAYQMRVALLDRGSKQVGSANQFVEVPDLKKHGVTLSGIVLENMSLAEFNRLAGAAQEKAVSSAASSVKADPLQDTSLRKFKRGTVLRYGVEIYNPKLAAGQPQICIQTRVFHDRQLVYSGREAPLDLTEQGGAKEPVFTDAVQLGENLLPGDYVLQVVVTDGLAREKRRIATQYVQFEVVE